MADLSKKGNSTTGTAVATNHNSVLEAFVERIKASEFTDATRGKFLHVLADRESEKRVSALVIGFDNIQKLENEYRKLNRPDDVRYHDAEGTQASSTFSKGRIDELKRLKERIEKYDRAFNEAVAHGKFDELWKLNNEFKDKGGGGKPDKGDDAKETS
jgi:hypothetical protein